MTQTKKISENDDRKLRDELLIQEFEAVLTSKQRQDKFTNARLLLLE